MSSVAYNRLDVDYNFAGYPSCFFNGGDSVLVGGYTEPYFRNIMNAIGGNPVEEVDMIIGIEYPSANHIISRVRVTNGPPGSANVAPVDPAAPTGPVQALPGVSTEFYASTTDGDSDTLFYQFDWGDRAVSDWVGPFASGELAAAEHAYQTEGPYDITVRARDIFLTETGWSPAYTVQVGCCVMVGDITSNGVGPDIDDLIYLVGFMFQDGPEPPCMAHADVDFIPTASPDINDLIYLVQFMFQEGPDLAPCPY